jgi:DNA polymerase III epsilon subunit-like protein
VNLSNYLVLDFETDGVDPNKCQPLELAALVLDPRTLLPIDGGEFNSLIRPSNFDTLDMKSFEKHKIDLEELKQAPDQKSVWLNFVDFVKSYNVKDSKFMRKPVPCGYNIKNYDLIICKRLNDEYYKKDIFSWTSVDVMDITFLWFESNPKLPNLKFDTLREFFGFASDSAHRAMFDVQQTADLLARYIRLMRRTKVQWHT